MGVSKSFGTNITENHLDNLFASFFGRALDKMCKNGNIWPKMTKTEYFGPKELVPFTQLVKVRGGNLVWALPSIQFS